jgi:hypothetical protein
VEGIWVRFGIRVHRHSVERALQRTDRLEPESADEFDDVWCPFDE